MAGSKRVFTYTLIPPAGEDTKVLAARARRILAWACDGDDRIVCQDISGEAVGVVTLNLTIQGRDQWWSRQLAQDIVNYVTWGLANPARLQLDSKREAPHHNRGYSGGRTKRWRDRSSREA